MQSLSKHAPLGLVDREPAPNREPAPKAEAATPSADYEIVIGRRQIASLLFLAIALAVIFSAVSYLAGRRSGPKPVQSAAAPPVVAVKPPPATPSPAIEATTTVLPPEPVLPVAKHDTKPEPPMFAEPTPGAVYLQMGAVDKGMAMVFAAGLRRYGFDSFVAPGPSEKIFRVLIGPLPDPDSFRRAQAMVDAIDLGTFARKYQK
jgi:hypothetical protein